jgi:hypothetical protein
MPAGTICELARSLSHFQLGESGEGTYLLRQARHRHGDDAAYREALALFIFEEKEHARLLERLVRRFGGRLVKKHWTHSIFRLVRRALGVSFEIQVLVIAELIGTAYYRLLAEHVADDVLRQVCDLVLRDEARHVAFHIDRLCADQAAWLPAERAFWQAQFQALFLAALQVAWIDHRSALREFQISTGDFQREARGECIRFLAALAFKAPFEPEGAASSAPTF